MRENERWMAEKEIHGNIKSPWMCFSISFYKLLNPCLSTGWIIFCKKNNNKYEGFFNVFFDIKKSSIINWKVYACI
jgi:hypothetical protein